MVYEKKAIFFIAVCLLLIASITYIICNKREQVPPMLVWEDQEYYVTNEPAKAEEVGRKFGEVTKKIETSKKPTKDSESNILEEKTEVFEMIFEEEDKRLPILVKEPHSEECREVRPMLK
ncbi:hypothetical protein [Bacillus mycoides]|nr:hypothetical protein [Bacillus mycoides]MBG9595676.1 hypothetical protein [Bacillus mycoides]MCD4646898.1 hypothetical protein [Bacillus mycoides]MDR4900737.1 hypothetical protein [Bacillus mycoides]MED0887019.1 hypothetical protein [Bacillus mycoides]MED0925823.1 hypothetical protein [Bacillus mycoides]